jgi:hypothetical protein
MSEPVIHIALPVMDESTCLPELLSALMLQTIQDYRLYVCVNQPDEWWSDPQKSRVCLENQAVFSFIDSFNDPRIRLIDKTSRTKGWTGKVKGIGWARKTLMDLISSEALPSDIILSLDADTVFGPDYLESVRTNVIVNPETVGFSIPYYHRLTGEPELDRVMLRYEIYMRAYAINLWRIQSPYSFSALGSAIALPVWSYRAIGGITPKLCGEDFYFLQKLVKYGTVMHWNGEMVFPAARLSERVFFGTGPALIKGLHGDWSSYPVYCMNLFEPIEITYKLFPKLLEKDIPTPLDGFLESRSGGLPWIALRRNSRTLEQFVRACHEKLDGLRILQYLKECNRLNPFNDEIATLELLAAIQKEQGFIPGVAIPGSFSFSHSSIELLDEIRNVLAESEMSYRKQHWTRVTGVNAMFN